LLLAGDRTRSQRRGRTRQDAHGCRLGCRCQRGAQEGGTAWTSEDRRADDRRVSCRSQARRRRRRRRRGRACRAYFCSSSKPSSGSVRTTTTRAGVPVSWAVFLSSDFALGCDAGRIDILLLCARRLPGDAAYWELLGKWAMEHCTSTSPANDKMAALQGFAILLPCAFLRCTADHRKAAALRACAWTRGCVRVSVYFVGRRVVRAVLPPKCRRNHGDLALHAHTAIMRAPSHHHQQQHAILTVAITKTSSCVRVRRSQHVCGHGHCRRRRGHPRQHQGRAPGKQLRRAYPLSPDCAVLLLLLLLRQI
jgi:hypothetical protein